MSLSSSTVETNCQPKTLRHPIGCGRCSLILITVHVVLVASSCSHVERPAQVPANAHTWRLVNYVSEPPSAKIEVNGNLIGQTPCNGYIYVTGGWLTQACLVINAYPSAAGQVPQSKTLFVPPIPTTIYFNLYPGGVPPAPIPMPRPHREQPSPPVTVGTGTGWSIEAGYVVTNYHVVEDADSLTLVRSDGAKTAAQMAFYDKANDIAALTVEAPGWLPDAIPFSSDEASVGEEVFTIGFPMPDIMGTSSKATSGQINSRKGIGDDPRFFQISVPVQAGNSGGPLMNMRGEVVGLVTAKLSAAFVIREKGAIPENVNYAIKSSYIRDLLSSQPKSETGVHQLASGAAALPELVKRISPSVVRIETKTDLLHPRGWVRLEEGSLSIAVPQDWTRARPQNPAILLQAMSPREYAADTFLENVNLVVENLARDMTIEEYFDLSRTNMAKTLAGYQECSWRELMIDGADARELVYSYYLSGREIKLAVYVLLHGRRAYVITCAAAAETFEAYYGTFARITSSFSAG